MGKYISTLFFPAWYVGKVTTEGYANIAWETVSKEDLDKLLSKFYVEVRRQDGKPYSKGAYISIRGGLQRHLASEPWVLNHMLGSDPAFRESNSTMTGMFKLLSREGLDVTQHHAALEPQDLAMLKTSGVIGTHNPMALQYLVWLNIALHFGRRGQEGYRVMKLNTFDIKIDAGGRRYLEQIQSEITKNHKGDKIGNSYKPQGRIYEVLNDEYCPIRAFELYISLLNGDINCLWQRPNKDYLKTGNWYHKRVIGVHMLAGFLKNMCKAAGIKTKYTNHCTRVTTSVILNEAGFGENDVRHVTGHKSTSSLQHYIHRATETKKMKMADTISNAISSNYSLPSTSSSHIANPPPSPSPAIANPTPPTFATPSPTLAIASTSTKFRHPVTIQENNTPVIKLDNCEELSDDFMGNYMQLLESKVLNNGMLQNCTLIKPVFNITFQK